MLDVLIIGSGPAGLSAAIYASRAGLSTAVVTGDTLGGLLTTTEKIDNYIGMFGSSGVELAENFTEHAKKFGAELVRDSVLSISKVDGVFETVLSGGESLVSKTVVFAAGSTPRKLGVPGEGLSGVSYCATCDGMFFEDEDVAVVGGGETAAEDALYLANVASSVTVLVRGDSWRATAPAVEKLVNHPKVNILMNSSISEIIGEDGVSGAVINGSTTLDVTGVFVAVGQSPNSGTAESHVDLFEDGFIKCSNVEGFFVAGDIGVPEYRQVAVAVGDGAKAGIDATRFILNG